MKALSRVPAILLCLWAFLTFVANPLHATSITCSGGVDPYASGSPCRITATISYQGGTASGYYKVFPGFNNSFIDKPIIITDGIDPVDSEPGGSRKIDEIYAFINKPTSSGNLADRLRNEGYDIIILDFENGADYIQRNAFVVVELVNFINSQKSGNHQLVIGGPSMGGLVVRYALAYMEDNSMSHETNMYLSFDAPHRGANIPLSFQLWSSDRYGTDPFNVSLITWPIFKAISTNAAKQMLMVHHSASLHNSSDGKLHPNQLYTSFFSELRSFNNGAGYPCQTKNVAISNGSVSVTTTDQGRRIGVPQKDDNGDYVNPGVEAINFSIPGTLVYQRTMEWDGFGTDEVYARLSTFQGDLITKVPRYSPGIDGAPGGYGDVWQQTHDEIQAAGGSSILYVPRNSFIPTVSSLDFNTSDLYYPLGDEGADLINQIPFDDFFAPTGDNRDHIAVFVDTADWLYDQIVNGVKQGSVCGLRPDSPSNLRFASETGGQAPTLLWDASETSGVSYEVYRCFTDSGCNFWSKIATTSSTSYTDTDETIDWGRDATEVQYKVLSKKYSKESLFSNVVSIFVSDGIGCGKFCKVGDLQAGLQEEQAPGTFTLHENYPNPFNPTTEIRFELPEASHAALVVYDALGREVDRLVDRPLDAGIHRFTFDAADLPSGVYLYRLTAYGFTKTGNMLLMK